MTTPSGSSPNFTCLESCCFEFLHGFLFPFVLCEFSPRITNWHRSLKKIKFKISKRLSMCAATLWVREICRYFVCLGCGLTSASVSFTFSCELTSTLGCPKMHENAYFHLTLCIWLSLYLRNHHQNLVSFRVNMWRGHHFLAAKQALHPVISLTHSLTDSRLAINT